MPSNRVPGAQGKSHDKFSSVHSGHMGRYHSPPPGRVASLKHLHTTKKHQDKHRRKKPAPQAMAVPNTPEAFLKAIKNNEGNYPHMYRDSKGLVTVGIGFLIEDQATGKMSKGVEAWPWKWRDPVGKPLHPDANDIQGDFDAVKKQPSAQRAALYKAATHLDLDPTKIDTMFKSKVDDFINQLKAEFPSYETYPMEVRYALLDMIYNLGRGKEWKEKTKTGKTVLKKNGIHAYTQLRKALDARDWKKAGDASHRHGPGQARNDQIKSWFYHAASNESKRTEAVAVQSADGLRSSL